MGGPAVGVLDLTPSSCAESDVIEIIFVQGPVVFLRNVEGLEVRRDGARCLFNPLQNCRIESERDESDIHTPLLRAGFLYDVSPLFAQDTSLPIRAFVSFAV